MQGLRKKNDKGVTLKKHSALSGAGLRAWRKTLALTQGEAAEALGVKLRTIQNYEKEVQKIPRTLALACWALTKGRMDYAEGKPIRLKQPLALTLAGDDEKLIAKKTKKLAAQAKGMTPKFNNAKPKE